MLYVYSVLKQTFTAVWIAQNATATKPVSSTLQDGGWKGVASGVISCNYSIGGSLCGYVHYVTWLSKNMATIATKLVRTKVISGLTRQISPRIQLLSYRWVTSHTIESPVKFGWSCDSNITRLLESRSIPSDATTDIGLWITPVRPLAAVLFSNAYGCSSHEEV